MKLQECQKLYVEAISRGDIKTAKEFAARILRKFGEVPIIEEVEEVKEIKHKGRPKKS